MPTSDALPRRWCNRLQLGKHDGTDVLAISFSSPDLVGHAFGPRSQEIQDMYVRLDLAVGTLLDHLDAASGVMANRGAERRSRRHADSRAAEADGKDAVGLTHACWPR